jgi:hypothetical protein
LSPTPVDVHKRALSQPASRDSRGRVVDRGTEDLYNTTVQYGGSVPRIHLDQGRIPNAGRG